jgi:hypothetical protein
MGKGSAPSAPNPYQSANAQMGASEQAANYSKGLNATNVITPTGSTTWSVNPQGLPGAQGEITPGTANGTAGGGFNGMITPNGTGYDGNGGNGHQSQLESTIASTYPGATNLPPQYTETQTLSPNEQALLTSKEGLGLGAAGNAGSALQGWQLPSESQNGEFGGQAMQSAYGLETATMDPYWSQQQEGLDASLRNAGATPGTPAYDNAMKSFQANRTAAYGQAENQAFGQGLAAEGQQISDVNSAQGGQLSNFLSLIGQGNPSAGGAGGAGSGGGASVSAPDIMSAFQNQYQGELANYNAGVSSSNADIGALGSLAAAFIMA